MIMAGSDVSAMDLETFERLADTLIPSTAGSLSASQAGIAGPLLEKVAEFVPERLDIIKSVVDDSAGKEPDAYLDALRREDPVRYDGFCEMVAAVYFMAPEVRHRIRYMGRLPVAARSEVVDIEDLLMPVLEGDFAPRGFEA